jgi:hypothetical protein
MDVHDRWRLIVTLQQSRQTVRIEEVSQRYDD